LERRRIYEMTKPKAGAFLDGGMEVNGIIAAANDAGAPEIAPWR